MVAPAMFISHGSPMMALEKEGAASDQWKIAAGYLADVKSVVIMSPHWASTGEVGITGSNTPDIIHDFYGFADVLYKVSHPVQGNKALADKVALLLAESDFRPVVESGQPIDHGAWVPLKHLDPTGRLSVVQLSVDMSASPQQLYAMGEALSGLRKEGVAVIGSGAITHNLRHVFVEAAQSLDYVAGFRDWVRMHVTNNGIEDLFNARELSAEFVQAHPHDDHFRPLYFALGARMTGDNVNVLDGGVYDRCLAMENYLWHVS